MFKWFQERRLTLAMLREELSARASERERQETVDLPPEPDQVALAFAQALLFTGKYETPQAAIVAAWFAVPAFYTAREEYATKFATNFFVPVKEGEVSDAAEAAAAFLEKHGSARHIEPVDLGGMVRSQRATPIT